MTAPHNAGPHDTGPDDAGPDAIGPDAIGPDAIGPDAIGPDAMGPDAMGPDAMRTAETNACEAGVRPRGATGPQRTGGRAVRRRGLAAHVALPVGCATLLLIGAITAVAHGAVSGGWVLVLASMVVAAAGLVAEPGATLFVVCAAWLTVAGFSRPPYAQLQVTWLTGARAALVLSLAGLINNHGRRGAAQACVVGHTGSCGDWWPPPSQAAWWRELGPAGGLDRKRQLAGLALVAVLPLLTAVLVPAQSSLSLSDDLLIYLVGVVAVAVGRRVLASSRGGPSQPACSSTGSSPRRCTRSRSRTRRTCWPCCSSSPSLSR